MSPGEHRAHQTTGLREIREKCQNMKKNFPFSIFRILHELLMDYDQTERPPSQGIICYVIKIELKSQIQGCSTTSTTPIQMHLIENY